MLTADYATADITCRVSGLNIARAMQQNVRSTAAAACLEGAHRVAGAGEPGFVEPQRRSNQ
jgi:hypothetical protein